MQASFAQLLTPDALETRAQDVLRRGRRRQAMGLVLAAALLGIGAWLGLLAGSVFDGTLDGVIASNFLMLGGMVCLGCAWVAWVYSAGGTRLLETAKRLQQRAAHGRQADGDRP